MRRCPRLLCLAALLLFSTVSRAGEPLDAQIDSLMNAPEYRHAHWGILVVDLDSGETVYQWQPDKLFAPASTTKLYSVAAALEVLGTDHRFETPVYRRGEVSESGELDGDLILVASGDLTFGGRTTSDGKIAFADSDHTYANGNDKAELTQPDPLAGIKDLAGQIAESGIRRVRGDVLIDARLFESASSTGSGPSQLTPIIINDNLIDLTIQPTREGEPAEITWRPETAALRVECKLRTVAEGKEVETSIRGDDCGTITVTGQIPADHKPLVRVYEVPDPTAHARTLLIEALASEGVTVDAPTVRRSESSADLPKRDEYDDLPCVARLVSPPLSESARLILKVSHNLHASTLPLLIASRSGKRSLADGLKLQHDALQRIGVDVETISFGGAAGGARSDYVTPHATVQLLRAMAKRPEFDLYRDSLPVLGVDGTLADVVEKDSPARGKVQAKTGTLYWHNLLNDRWLLTSKALAGYITAASGRELAFAAFINHAHIDKSSDTARAGRTLGRLCEFIHATQ